MTLLLCSAVRHSSARCVRCARIRPSIDRAFLPDTDVSLPQRAPCSPASRAHEYSPSSRRCTMRSPPDNRHAFTRSLRVLGDHTRRSDKLFVASGRACDGNRGGRTARACRRPDGVACCTFCRRLWACCRALPVAQPACACQVCSSSVPTLAALPARHPTYRAFCAGLSTRLRCPQRADVDARARLSSSLAAIG